MNGEPPEVSSDELLNLVSGFLYGVAHGGTTVKLASIRTALSALNDAQIEDALQRLSRKELIQFSSVGQLVQLVPDGKLAYEVGCVPELVLGDHYITGKYSDAVVHIVVRTPQGNETGGTGFYVADFPGWLVTAWHVTGNGNEIVRIEDSNGTILHEGETIRSAESEELDLTLLRCAKPSAVIPLRIDWRTDGVRALDRVLVFGYPPVAGHEVQLSVATGEISSKPWRLGRQQQSLIITANIRGGYSGGPVVSESGLVLGVVIQENVVLQDGYESRCVTATPIHYLNRVVPNVG